ncbi:MAG: hypothetical protein QNJ46_23170 [Leptolyngbyaceae cyanobacterium MO_188.B28]|nr:hypothetical protein [Leptolyngbyaceae cyanobacterium MO_188.B28]
MHLVAKSILIFLTACGSISLIACANGDQATNTSDSSGTVTANSDDGHDSQHQGHTSIHSDITLAEIFMSDPYHLELIVESKDHGINLNFHLEDNESHEPILGAKVAAVVHTPNGKVESLSLQYETEGEHYIGSLETQATGQFRVTIFTDIDGNQIGADFSFDR